MMARVRRLAGVAVLGAASACGSASRNPAEVGGGDGGGAAGLAGGLGANGGASATGGRTGESAGGVNGTGAVSQGGMVAGTGAAEGGSAGVRTTGGAANPTGGGAGAESSTAGGIGGGGTGSGGGPSDCLGPDIDVPLFVLSGTVTSPGTRTAVASSVVFRNGDDHLSVAPGATPSSYGLRVVPGTYDIFYDDLSPIRAGVSVGATSPTTLDLEVRLSQLSLKVTVSGSAPTSNFNAFISLKSMYGIKQLGAITTPPVSLDVGPGSYDLIYDGLSASGLLPRNSKAKLQTVLVASSDLDVAVDIPSVLVSGHVTRGGQVLAGSAQGLVVGYFVNSELGKVPIAINEAGEYSVRALPGTYEVEMAGAGTLAGTRLSAAANSVFDIDFPNPPAAAALAEGSMKFNGNTVSDYWGLIFHETVGGADTPFVTSADAYSFFGLPGTYDVFYQVDKRSASSPTMPKNRRALLKSGWMLVANATKHFDLDIPVGVLKGKFTIAGTALPEVSGDGSLLLRDASGDEVPFDANYDGEYTLPVVTGAYDVYFKAGLFGSVAPRNTGKKLKSIVVSQGANPVDFDVPTRRIQGALKINGASAENTQELASITLRSENGDTVPLGSVAAKTYSTTVVPGTYDVYFSGRSTNTFAPVNPNAKIGCLRVP